MTKDLAERLRADSEAWITENRHANDSVLFYHGFRKAIGFALDRLSEVASGSEGVTKCPPCPICWCGRPHCRIHPDAPSSITDEHIVEVLKELRANEDSLRDIGPYLLRDARRIIEQLASAAKAEARVRELEAWLDVATTFGSVPDHARSDDERQAFRAACRYSAQHEPTAEAMDLVEATVRAFTLFESAEECGTEQTRESNSGDCSYTRTDVYATGEPHCQAHIYETNAERAEEGGK